MVNMAPFFFFFKPGTMSSFTMKFSWCFEKLMFCSFIYSFIHLLPCKSITKDHPSRSYDYCYCSDVATCIMCVWTVKHCGNVCVCRKSHRSSKNQGWVCSHILCCKLPIFFFTSERERERESERERERMCTCIHFLFFIWGTMSIISLEHVWKSKIVVYSRSTWCTQQPYKVST